MLQVRNTDMFQTAYDQLGQAERAFVDRMVSDIVDGAARHGGRIADLLDAPLPDALRERDTRGWLERPLVTAAISDRLREADAQSEISLDRLIREWYAIATFSLKQIISVDSFGDVSYDLDSMTDDQWGAIESIEFEKSDGLTKSTRTKVKIKTHNKLLAGKMLAEMLGGTEGAHSYRKSDKARNAPSLTDDRTSAALADDYARFAEGEE